MPQVKKSKPLLTSLLILVGLGSILVTLYQIFQSSGKENKAKAVPVPQDANPNNFGSGLGKVNTLPGGLGGPGGGPGNQVKQPEKKNDYKDLVTNTIVSVFKDTKYSKYIPFIIAQSAHETDNFKSSLLISANNPFGMKEAEKRTTWDLDHSKNVIGLDGKQGRKPDSVGYSEYYDLRQGVQDLLFWFDYVKFPTDLKNSLEYVQALKSKSYFEDSINNYHNGLIRFL